jgi:hypothetical protein
MKAPVFLRYLMRKGRGDGVARLVVSENGRIRGEGKERGSSEDGETSILKGRHGPIRVCERATLAS